MISFNVKIAESDRVADVIAAGENWEHVKKRTTLIEVNKKGK